MFVYYYYINYNNKKSIMEVKYNSNCIKGKKKLTKMNRKCD